MANIVQLEDFSGEILIPNTNDTKIASVLADFISVYERKALEKLLGYTLYKLFKTAYDIDQTLAADVRFKNILNGDEFTSPTLGLRKWNGLKSTTEIISPLAGYVYYYYMKSFVQQNSGFGVISTKGDSADIISPAIKMCNAYNIFARSGRILLDYLHINASVYTELTYTTKCQIWSDTESKNEFGL